MNKPGANIARLTVEQRLLTNYASFPFDQICGRILGGLNRLGREEPSTYLSPR